MPWPASMVARKVREHIEKYTSENPVSDDYPARDREKLEKVAAALMERLAPVAENLDEILPSKLESEARISSDVRNAAVETTKRLLQLVPGALEAQLGEVRKGMEYAWAREAYDDVRNVLRAAPLLQEEIAGFFVHFAVANDVTPEQLERFQKQLTALLGMLETERDTLVDAGFGEKILALERLTRIIGAAAAPS